MTLAVGLTGGIGAGKSAVADRLVERGAVVIDSDVIAREVVAPGGAAYERLVERFGRGVLLADGTLDRPALAAVVFSDPAALSDLNAITHPVIGAEMASRLEALSGDDVIAVAAIPLLNKSHRNTLGLAAVVVVDCPTEVAIERLVTWRSMARADAEARVAAQISREERLELADFVVDNSGSLEALGAEVDRLWTWIGDLGRRIARGV